MKIGLDLAPPMLAGFAALVAGLLGGCAEPLSEDSSGSPVPERLAMRELDPPAAAGAFAPRLVAADGELLMTWWEPLEAPEGSRRHRLMFSRFIDAWSEPSVVVEGDDFFANWADFPSVIREPRGSLLVHWLQKTAQDTFAYSIYLGRSSDDGSSWQPLGKLNDDATHTEHGFVSMVPEGDAVRAYWLDGREMAVGGPMTVRTALVRESAGASELLDDRVCECCPTDAAVTADGSLLVYRDRAMDETREIFAVRRHADAWSEPEPMTNDGWRIPGCPVNGPAVDHRTGGPTAVAWFTGAGDAPRVSVGFGETASGVPIVVDDEVPLGRVGLAIDTDGSAVVSWLAFTGEEAELRLRRVAPDGLLGESLPVGRTSHSRSSGMPQLERLGGSLYVGWVEVFQDVPSRIRVREVPAVMVPAAREPSRPG